MEDQIAIHSLRESISKLKKQMKKTVPPGPYQNSQNSHLNHDSALNLQFQLAQQKKLNRQLIEENTLLKQHKNNTDNNAEINIYNLVLSKAIGTLKLYNEQIDTSLENLNIDIPIIETPKNKEKMMIRFPK